VATIHRTTLTPTKLELLQVWLPRQSWFEGDAPSLTRVGGFRLDDPAGEVGIEALLVADARGRVYHVPLTYRAAPLAGATLVGTAEHGVLGTRWVHDAAKDPVALAQLAALARGEVTAQHASLTDTPDDSVRVEPAGRLQQGGEAGQDSGAGTTDVVVEVLRGVLDGADGIAEPLGVLADVSALVRLPAGERRVRVLRLRAV
jgi:hypothetical protein